jgi:hypothetical protein
MFLARREEGQRLYVYPLREASGPCAWPFDGRHPETGLTTSAAMSLGLFNGIAATGETRAAAIQNLEIAEQAGIEELYAFTAVTQ